MIDTIIDFILGIPDKFIKGVTSGAESLLFFGSGIVIALVISLLVMFFRLIFSSKVKDGVKVNTNPLKRTITKGKIHSEDIEQLIEASKEHLKNAYSSEELDGIKNLLDSKDYIELDNIMYKEYVEKLKYIFNNPYDCNLIKILISSQPRLIRNNYFKWVKITKNIDNVDDNFKDKELKLIRKNIKKHHNLLVKLQNEVERLSEENLKTKDLKNDINSCQKELKNLIKSEEERIIYLKENVDIDSTNKMNSITKKIIENPTINKRFIKVDEKIQILMSRVRLILDKELITKKKVYNQVKGRIQKQVFNKIIMLFENRNVRNIEIAYSENEVNTLKRVYNLDLIEQYFSTVETSSIISIKTKNRFKKIYLSKKSQKISKTFNNLSINDNGYYNISTNTIESIKDHTQNIIKVYNSVAKYVNKDFSMVSDYVIQLSNDIASYYYPHSKEPLLELTPLELFNTIKNINYKIELFLKKKVAFIVRGMTIEKITTLMGKGDVKKEKKQGLFGKLVSKITMPLKSLATSKFVLISFSEYILNTVGKEINSIYSQKILSKSIEISTDDNCELDNLEVE